MNRADRRRQEKQQAKARSVVAANSRLERLLREGVAHQKAGRLDAAEGNYKAALKIEPNNPLALNFLGALLSSRGAHEAAVSLIKKAVVIAPQYADAYVNLATPLFALGRADEAKKYVLEALEQKPDHAAALFKLSALQRSAGDKNEAAATLRLLLRTHPNHVNAQLRYADMLFAAAAYDRAEQHYRKALSLNPNLREAYNGLAKSLLARGDPGAAAEQLRKALALRPHDAEAHFRLIEMFDLANRDQEMRAALDDAEAVVPADANIRVMRARLLCIEGDYAAARQILEDVPDGVEILDTAEATRARLLGEIYERDGQSEKAFEKYEHNNRIFAASSIAKQVPRAEFIDHLDVLLRQFNSAWVDTWRAVTPPDDRPGPIFLVGFPRSGTTLLESFIRGHSEFAVLEEKSMSKVALTALEKLPGGDPLALADLEPERLATLRRAYFEELDRHLTADQRAKAIVDKHPLNMAYAGMLHRMFPDAKFIFAERDPRDCVLSAFFQGFGLNAAMANFLELRHSAELYDKAMSLWTEYNRLLPLQVFKVRYESIVDEPESILRSLFTFLGKEWRAGVLDHSATARQRKLITSASHRQVTRKLYTTSRGRWRRFEKQLEPVRPTLDKWAERLGYEV